MEYIFILSNEDDDDAYSFPFNFIPVTCYFFDPFTHEQTSVIALVAFSNGCSFFSDDRL